MHQQWSECAIHQLRTAFLQGKSIKMMARELKRTPTAINKALSRFGLRPTSRLKHLPHLRTIGSVQSTQTCSRETCKASTRDDPKRSTSRPTTNLETIVQFLRSHGFIVQPSMHAFETFFVDHATMNARQILLKANQICVRDQLPLFSIPYLMA
jgi:hypothetical protein